MDNAAAVAVHDALADGQPHAVATAAAALNGGKTLEQVRDVGGIDAAAVIDDGYVDLAVMPGLEVGLDRHRAGRRTMGDRIGEKIHEHLF
jgi:hypothetical protein